MSFFYLKRHLLKSLYTSIFIAERNIFKGYIASYRGRCSSEITYLGYFRKKFIDALLRGFRLLHNRTHPTHCRYRPSEHHHVNTKLYNHPNRLYFSQIIQTPSNKNHKDKAKPYHQYHSRNKKGLYLSEFNTLLPPIFSQHRQLGISSGFISISFDNPYTRKRFLSKSRKV